MLRNKLVNALLRKALDFVKVAGSFLKYFVKHALAHPLMRNIVKVNAGIFNGVNHII